MKRGPAALVALVLALVAFSNAYADSYLYTALDYPGATFTGAFGINDAGTIVGAYGYASGMEYGFTLSGGTYTSLNSPAGVLEAEARSINNAGTIVGSCYTASIVYGFSLSGGVYTTLSYPGAVETEAVGINDAGTIVGIYNNTGSYPSSSFSLSGTTWTILSYPGAVQTEAVGINDAGTIVGDYSGYGFSLSGGVYTTLSYPGATSTDASGINNAGTIVGSYVTPGGSKGEVHGFVPEQWGLYLHRLSRCYITEAFGINDAGDIVGVWEDASGVSHGFLATPIPTPNPACPITLTPAAASYLYTGTPLDSFTYAFLCGGCPASIIPSDPSITIGPPISCTVDPDTGGGSGQVSFSVANNTGGARSGGIYVEGSQFAITQSAAPLLTIAYPAGGTYNSPGLTVSLVDPQAPSGSIRYTTDSSDPTTSTSASTYTAPISIFSGGTSTTLKFSASYSTGVYGAGENRGLFIAREPHGKRAGTPNPRHRGGICPGYGDIHVS